MQSIDATGAAFAPSFLGAPLVTATAAVVAYRTSGATRHRILAATVLRRPSW